MTPPSHIKSAPWLNDPAVRDVVAALSSEPGKMRFVGGCVRNTLMGEPVADIDIATSYAPEQVIELLEAAGLKAIPTGLSHGTITAVARHTPVEITTLRADVETDGRRAVVAFTQDWEEDAKRRDFTMNAIYADPDGALYDPVGGIVDALSGQVRFIGEAAARIREDYLRILRFFRFLSQYGGTPDPDGIKACAAEKGGLAGLSGERIFAELEKLLKAPHAVQACQAMDVCGVLTEILPSPLHIARLERLTEIEKVVAREPDAWLRLCAVLPNDLTKLSALSSRLRMPNVIAKRLRAAVGGDALASDIPAQKMREDIYRHGKTHFIDRLLLSWSAHESGDAAPWQNLLSQAEAWVPPTFPLTGEDAIAAGMSTGPELGALLKKLETDWVAEDFRPDRARLLEMLRKEI